MTDLTNTLRELRTEVNSNVFAFGFKYCRRQSAVYNYTKEEVIPSIHAAVLRTINRISLSENAHKTHLRASTNSKRFWGWHPRPL